MRMITKATSDGVGYASKSDYEWEGKNYDADLKNGDTVKITGDAVVETGQYGDQHYFRIETRNGEKKTPFNQTTINVLVSEFGDESEAWLGKEVKVILKPDTINGKRVLVAYFVSGDWSLDEWGAVSKPEESTGITENTGSADPVPESVQAARDAGEDLPPTPF